MNSLQLRANARESLKGYWGKAALLTLCYGIIMFAINFFLALIPLIGAIVSFIICVPISYGYVTTFIKLKRHEEVTYTDFLSTGFENFGKAWGVTGNIILKMILPIALVIIFVFVLMFGVSGSIINSISYYSSYSSSLGLSAGFSGLALIGVIGYIASIIYCIIKAYLYVLSYYILYDNPTMTGKEIVEESARLMKGNRWSFLWLGLTFIGWAILSIFTLYIGYFWLIPYFMVTFVCFYESLAKNSSIVDTNIDKNSNDNNPISE